MLAPLHRAALLAQLHLLVCPAALAAPIAAITSTPSLVYDFYTQHCPQLPQPGCSLDIDPGCDCDIADAPLRMWRRSDGQVVSLASVDLGSRGFEGPSALALAHTCTLYANSSREQAFEAFADYEWLHSTWSFANSSVYALTHMEWDCKDPQTCAFFGLGFSFFSAITLMRSLDGGATWAHALPPPAHIVAVSPVAWTSTIGAAGQSYGFRSPSSIVAGRGAQEGFYYVTVTAGWGRGSFQGQLDGACMMRTRDVTAPGSWRAWGGSAFDVDLTANPYAGAVNPSAHVCVPFTNSTYASLVWSTVYGQYVYFGTAGGNDHGGWELRLSADLETWSAPTHVDAPPQFINPAGNASITPSGASFAGRFVQRKDHGGDPEVWWEDAAHTVKRAVHSCTPCPGLDACGSALVQISDSEFDALEERPAFSCSWQYNTSGYGAFYYPTLVDPASPSDNFDEVGATAQLFLIGQRCVNAAGDGSCSPFDQDGLLVRNVLRVPVAFAGNASMELAA